MLLGAGGSGLGGVEDLMELGQDCSFGSGADEPGGGSSVQEVEQRGNGLDTVAQAQVWVVVSVDGDEFQASGTSSGDLVQHRAQRVTRPAPRCPEGS